MRSTSQRSNALKLTSSILGSALFSLLVGCAPSAYDGGPRTPTVLWGPGQGAPGPGTPRVHLELDPPDSTLPEVELRQVAGLEAQLVSGGGPMASWQGARIVPGSIGICPVPCGAVINGRENRDFFFGGPGVRVSSHFQLGNEGGDILIKVHPRSGVQWKAGEVLTILGSPLLLLGTIVLTNNLIKGADSTAPATARRKRAAPILEGRILDAKGAGKVRHLARNRPLGSPSGKIACFSPTLGVASREDVLVDGDAGEEFGGWLAAEGFVADA